MRIMWITKEEYKTLNLRIKEAEENLYSLKEKVMKIAVDLLGYKPLNANNFINNFMAHLNVVSFIESLFFEVEEKKRLLKLKEDIEKIKNEI